MSLPRHTRPPGHVLYVSLLFSGLRPSALAGGGSVAAAALNGERVVSHAGRAGVTAGSAVAARRGAALLHSAHRNTALLLEYILLQVKSKTHILIVPPPPRQ
jgi:hypothetical protein